MFYPVVLPFLLFLAALFSGSPIWCPSYAPSTLTHLVNGPFFGMRQRQNWCSFETSILCFNILHVESYLHAQIPITTHSLGFEILRCNDRLIAQLQKTCIWHMNSKEIGEICLLMVAHSDFRLSDIVSPELLGLFCRSIWVCLFACHCTANQPLRLAWLKYPKHSWSYHKFRILENRPKLADLLIAALCFLAFAFSCASTEAPPSAPWPAEIHFSRRPCFCVCTGMKLIQTIGNQSERQQTTKH